MNKSALIFTTGIKQESKTALNTLIRSIGYIVIVYIFIQIWQFIYGQAGYSQVIEGFSLDMMIWYLIITETITISVSTRAAVKEISNDVRSGKIAYQLTRPYNFFTYQVTNQFAIASFRSVFIFLSGLMLGFVFVGFMPNFNAAGLLLGLVCIAIGIFLHCLIFTIIGMLAFWVENATPYAWLFGKLFFIFGLFFPPEIFGGWIKQVIIYSPLGAALSGPARLFVNFSWPLFAETIIVQSVWLIIFIMLGHWMYKRGTKKVNVYGG